MKIPSSCWVLASSFLFTPDAFLHFLSGQQRPSGPGVSIIPAVSRADKACADADPHPWGSKCPALGLVSVWKCCCLRKREPENEASHPVSPRCSEARRTRLCSAIFPPSSSLEGSQPAIQRAGGLNGGIQIADPSWPHLPLQHPA